MLLNVLKRMMSWDLLIFTIDNIEQMILLASLELLRFGAKVHSRGILLSAAGRLDLLLNATRAVLAKDREFDPECSGFADTIDSKITAWNDEEKEKPDFLRSHLMHFEISIKVGYGIQVNQKRNWNGSNLEGIRQTDKEIKKRLRLIKINDEHDTVFRLPVFDTENGTFNLKNKDVLDTENSIQPLVPRGRAYIIKTLIR